MPEVREVVKTVNGQLLADLAEAVGHADAAAVELLRQGAPLYGNLENCGLGVPRDVTPAKAIEALRGSCEQSNENLFASLKEDQYSQELYTQTCEDAKLGRMTAPQLASACELQNMRASPRFGVEQGIRLDGTLKIRPIDNLSWSAP